MWSLVVIVVAVCLGGVVAGVDIAASSRLFPAQQRVPGKMSLEETRLICTGCLVFYEVVYGTGLLLYRLVGLNREAEELRSWSRQHLLVLNGVGGGWLVIEGLLALPRGVFRPSLLVGAIMLVWSSIEAWRTISERRRGGSPRSSGRQSEAESPTPGWEVIASGSQGPGPRSRHGLVYDSRANVAVLFGGIVWGDPPHLMADTWELRNRRWTSIKTPVAPSARHRGAMVFFAPLGQTLLFGGQDQKHQLLGDTWFYSRGRWRQVAVGAPVPSPRCGHSLAFDERTGVAVLFGGIGAGDQLLGDTWNPLKEKLPQVQDTRLRFVVSRRLLYTA